MNKGNVIILNGTSSAGKTTLARALQAALDEPYMCLSTDLFLPTLPVQYLNSEAPGASRWIVHADPAPRVEIQVGPVENRMIVGMYYAVAAFAAQGNSIILDDLMFEPEWLRAATTALTGIHVVFVGVHCPLSVLEERERARGDRVVGLARGLIERVHTHAIYDLELDTVRDSVEACVSKVRGTIQARVTPTAFDSLREQCLAHQDNCHQ